MLLVAVTLAQANLVGLWEFDNSADLAAARSEGIQSATDAPAEHQRRNDSDFLKVKTREGKVDFYSLRHTITTYLVQNRTGIKTAQGLLRHSTPAMTLGGYVHQQAESLTAAVNALPDLEGEKTILLTGTDFLPVDAVGQNQAEKKVTEKYTESNRKTLQNVAHSCTVE